MVRERHEAEAARQRPHLDLQMQTKPMAAAAAGKGGAEIIGAVSGMQATCVFSMCSGTAEGTFESSAPLANSAASGEYATAATS